MLSTDGTGNLSWISAGGSSYSPLTEVSVTPTMSTRNYTFVVGGVINGVTISAGEKWINGITISDPTVQSLSFTDLKGSTGIVMVGLSPNLTSFSLPISTVISEVIIDSLNSGSSKNLVSFSAPLLADIAGNLELLGCSSPLNSSFNSLDVSSLNNVNLIKMSDYGALTTLNLSSVGNINSSQYVFSASASVSLIVTGCTQMTNVTLGTSLKKVASGVIITGASLSQSSVDNVLIRLAALDGTGGTTLYTGSKVINLSGGTSSAPSAAGITAKNTLVARGVTVTTN